MSTLAQITAAINDDIRNKTPLVLKTEHADVEQLITDEMFPLSAKIEYQAGVIISPITDIVINPSLASLADIEFKIYFDKIGNHVFVNGFISSLEDSKTIGQIVLATFPTSLYRPLSSHTTLVPLIVNSLTVPNILQNCSLFITRDGSSPGLKIVGSMPPSFFSYRFSFHYKVAN
jgi:hypothetical protein